MRMLRSALLALAVLSIIGVSPVGASSSSPDWPVAQIMTLPSGATSVDQGYLPGLSCPSAGNCSAGGAISVQNGTSQAFVIDESSGSWKTPHQLLAPTDAGSNPFTTINNLSCATPGNCSAVGSYQDANGDAQSFVADETSSSWSGAEKVTLPADALAKGQSSNVRAVSCASPGNCSAVGTYLDNSSALPRLEGFALREFHGAWGAASRLQLPPRANFDPFVAVSQVACTSADNCAAVGSYIDAQNFSRPLLLSEARAKWTARTISLPGNANAYPHASLSELTCVSVGGCVAIGTYATHTGAIEGFAVTQSAGTWGRALAMTMPTNGASNPRVFFYGFSGISCPSIGNCSSGGQYVDAAGQYQGFLINEVDSDWQSATEMALPTGALFGGKNGGVVAVSCTNNESCSAGGAYIDATGNYQALLINRVNSVWQPGTTVVLPAGAPDVGTGGGIYGLVCHVAGPCSATGTYLDASGNYQGLTLASS